jgi:hypothetical protein
LRLPAQACVVEQLHSQPAGVAGTLLRPAMFSRRCQTSCLRVFDTMMSMLALT